MGREVKPLARTRALKGGRAWWRVQRWVSEVATAVPRDWPNKTRREGAIPREGGLGMWRDETGPPLRTLGPRPVRKERRVSASVVNPSSVGDPVLSPNPR